MRAPIAALTTSSTLRSAQPPRVNPPRVSSSGRPGPCITPSSVTWLITTIRLISASFGIIGTMTDESLWPRLADLPLTIQRCEYERMHAVLAHEFDRVTTQVRLVGDGAEGLGEDVSPFKED